MNTSDHKQAWAEYKLRLERDGHEGGRMAIARIAHSRGWLDCCEAMKRGDKSARDAEVAALREAVRTLRQACEMAIKKADISRLEAAMSSTEFAEGDARAPFKSVSS